MFSSLLQLIDRLVHKQIFHFEHIEEIIRLCPIVCIISQNPFLGQRLHSLDFDNDLPVAVKVWDIRFLDRRALIEDAKLLLCVEWYVASRELAFKALLVYLFPEAVSEFAVDLVDRTANGVALVWIYHLTTHDANYSKNLHPQKMHVANNP